MASAPVVRWTRVGLLAVVILAFPTFAQAGWLGAGCWVCDYLGLTGMEARCDMVANSQNGDGTNCYETYEWGWYCQTNSTPCYNTTVDGGGGDGGGAGVCTVGANSWCPAECPRCQRREY